MRAKDLMTTPVVTVRLDTPAKEAARLLASRGFTALPVVDDDDTVLGIVTEADLIDGQILPDPRSLIGDDPPPPPAPRAHLVADAMTNDPVVVASTTDAVEVARVMLERHLRTLPVVDDGRLVGIVTRRDLLRTIARHDRDIAQDVRHRLAIACRGSWNVDVTDGVVTLSSDRADASERHVAQVVAAALPGVLGVHLAVR